MWPAQNGPGLVLHIQTKPMAKIKSPHANRNILFKTLNSLVFTFLIEHKYKVVSSPLPKPYGTCLSADLWNMYFGTRLSPEVAPSVLLCKWYALQILWRKSIVKYLLYMIKLSKLSKFWNVFFFTIEIHFFKTQRNFLQDSILVPNLRLQLSLV